MGKLQDVVCNNKVGRVIRTGLIAAILVFIYPVMTHCQTPSEHIVEVTIDEHDKLEIIYRLEELKVRREQIKMFETIIARDRAQDERELELNNKQMVMLTEERDLWKGKAENYKQALDDAMRGRSKLCWTAKIFTLGLARCK